MTELRLNFMPPAGWRASKPPGDRPGAWYEWAIRDGDAVHSLVLSITRVGKPAAAFGPDSAAAMRSLSGTSDVRGSTTTTCGDVPAYTFTYRSDRTPGHPMIVRHVIVDIGRLLGDLSYAHPPDVADRPDAVDAMSTLCEQRIYAMRPPAGWEPAAMGTGQPGVAKYLAPSGDASLTALAVSAPTSMASKAVAPTTLSGGATMLGEADETCGSLRVHRSRWRTAGSSDVQLVEQVSGYRHGAAYLYTYARAEKTALDPAAQHALTSFCDADATLATPAPRPSPNPPA